MHSILYVEINVFALVVLYLIYLNVRLGRADKYLLEQKLFLLLMLGNALVLIFDSFMWMLDGTGGALMREMNLFMTACYYALNPIVCMMWSYYADYLIYRSERHLLRILIPLLIPAGVVAVLSFLSMFNGTLFFIDANNIYHRGELFLLMAAVSYAYLLYTLFKIMAMHDRIQKNDFIPILIFALPPFVGGIVQILYYGVSAIWVCTTISILIVFINIQNHQMYTDYLTGLFNRRQLDNHLTAISLSNKKKGLLGGLMIDLNDFKMINDKYGHDVGDQALKDTADILKNTFRKRDFIARYGGDEFMVVMEIEHRRDLINAVNRLRENIAAFNEKSTAPYAISLSIGYDCLDCRSNTTIEEFGKHIDILMYRDKQSYDDHSQLEYKENDDEDFVEEHGMGLGA